MNFDKKINHKTSKEQFEISNWHYRYNNKGGVQKKSILLIYRKVQ